MEKARIEKWALSLLLLCWWLLLPVIGYGGSQGETLAHGTVLGHLLYPLSHGNVWHLAGNVFVLWCIPGRLRLLQDYVIAVACSLLPVFGFWEMGMTVGFSGVLFAEIGIRWGVWCRRKAEAGCRTTTTYWRFCIRVMPWVLAFAFVPHINWCIHLYCVLVGLAYGRWKG